MIAVTKKVSMCYLMLIAGIMVVVGILILFALRYLVLKPLNIFNNGLNDFFKFVNKEQENWAVSFYPLTRSASPSPS